MLASICDPALEGWRKTNLSNWWALGQWEILTQKIKWRLTEEDTWHWPLASMHMCMHTRTYTYNMSTLKLCSRQLRFLSYRRYIIKDSLQADILDSRTNLKQILLPTFLKASLRKIHKALLQPGQRPVDLDSQAGPLPGLCNAHHSHMCSRRCQPI